MIDTEEYPIEEKYNDYITYIDNNFDNIFEKLDKLVSESYDKYVNNNYSKKGLELPTKEILRNCFNYNSDGAGIMFNDGKQVFIEKGFMDFATSTISLS